MAEKFHLIAMPGDQNPHLNSNEGRIKSAADEIIDLLKPVGLWVVASPEDDTVQTTADCLNQALGTSSLDETVSRHKISSEGFIDREGPEAWLMYLGVLNDLALIKNRSNSPTHTTGLILVTHESVVRSIPDVVGERGYDEKTNTQYAGINHLTLHVDELGKPI